MPTTATERPRRQLSASLGVSLKWAKGVVVFVMVGEEEEGRGGES